MRARWAAAYSAETSRCHRNRDEIGIAEQRGAVGERELHRLRDPVQARGGARAERREIEALQDPERLEQDHAARRGRRERDHLEAAVAAAQRRPQLRGVGREVGAGDETAALRLVLGDRRADLAPVERALPLRRELAQRAREIGLAQPPAGLGARPRRRELDPQRLVAEPRREPGCAQALQHARVVGADREALLGEPDRGLHHARERERAPALLRQREAGHQTRRRDRERAQQRGALRHAGREVHLAARRGRRRLARIEREDRAVREPEQDEGAAADPGRERLADAEGEGRRDRRVHRVSAGLQHLDTGARRVRLRRDHHPAARERRCGPGRPRGGRYQQQGGEQDRDELRERSRGGAGSARGAG